MNYILITGYPRDSTTTQMEVIDNNGNTRLCQKDHSKYPEMISVASATYTNEKILVCGGYPSTDQCYIYEKGKGWSPISKMSKAKYSMATIPIDGGMVVAGGWSSTYLDSSEIIQADGSSITEGPELPEPRYGQCVAYDKENDVIFLIRGWNTGGRSQEVWKFKDPKTLILNGTTHMNTPRYDAGCGIVRSKHHDGRPLIVVGGSILKTDPGSKICEFLDYTKSDQWQFCSKSNSSFLVLHEVPRRHCYIL